MHALNRPPASYIAMFRFLFSGSGIWAMISVASLAVAYKSLWGEWSILDVLAVVAFFVFRGVVEWCIHAWLYHARPLPLVRYRLKTGTHMQHLDHHRRPDDLSRLLITYKGVLVLSLAVLMVFLVFFQSFNAAATMVLGFIVVGVMIEVLHLICHCEIPHRSQGMKRLVWLHRYHHRHDGSNFFGVSSSLGDRLLGTFPALGKGDVHD